MTKKWTLLPIYGHYYQYMDATTEIWTLRPRNRRNDQEMDITTKIWTLQPRYGRMTKLLTLLSRNGRQRLRYDNFFEKYRLLKTVVIKKDEKP